MQVCTSLQTDNHTSTPALCPGIHSCKNLKFFAVLFYWCPKCASSFSNRKSQFGGLWPIEKNCKALGRLCLCVLDTTLSPAENKWTQQSISHVLDIRWIIICIVICTDLLLLEQVQHISLLRYLEMLKSAEFRDDLDVVSTIHTPKGQCLVCIGVSYVSWLHLLRFDLKYASA